jgi:hypothetical protein
MEQQRGGQSQTARGALAVLLCLARTKGRGGGARTYLGEEEETRPRRWPRVAARGEAKPEHRDEDGVAIWLLA